MVYIETVTFCKTGKILPKNIKTWFKKNFYKNEKMICVLLPLKNIYTTTYIVYIETVTFKLSKKINKNNLL